MSATDAPAASTAPSRVSRRKRKRTDENLDEGERLRRQLQRQKQELALKLRAEGKTYKPQKAKNSSTKAEVGPEPFKVAVSSQQHHKQPSSQQHQQQQQQQQATPAREETGTRPDGDVQVIIVPIFWNKKADEKTTVVSAAEEVQQQLQELGITVGLDTTNADTPGQKYKYWEQKGVRVRIELGPRDAQKNQACLAISTTPGEVAKKTSYQIGSELNSAVQKALASFATTTSAATADPADGSSGQPQTASKKQKAGKKQKQPIENAAKPSAKVDSPVEDVEPSREAGDGSEQVQPAKSGLGTVPSGETVAKAKKPHLAGGDDLGDEFAIDIDAAEDEGAKKKKKKKTISSSVAEMDNAAGQAKGSKGKKSQHKVVQF